MQYKILCGLLLWLLVSLVQAGPDFSLKIYLSKESTDTPCLNDDVVHGSCVMYYNCKKINRNKRTVDSRQPIPCGHYLEVCCPKDDIVEDNDNTSEI